MHLIGVVSWMAGMFYLVRIMVYHAEAWQKPEAERSILLPQFNSMEWKAYRIILRPAIVITWSFGVLMLCIQPAWLQEAWMHLKLTFLLLLTAYSHYLQSHIRRLEAGRGWDHLRYRALNEVPTIFLVGIVFLAVFKNRIHYPTLLGGIAVFTALIAWGIHRANRPKD
jgi:protoporphyrinogen IX oxidase